MVLLEQNQLYILTYVFSFTHTRQYSVTNLCPQPQHHCLNSFPQEIGFGAEEKTRERTFINSREQHKQ